jgi:hypothetical protein
MDHNTISSLIRVIDVISFEMTVLLFCAYSYSRDMRLLIAAVTCMVSIVFAVILSAGWPLSAGGVIAFVVLLASPDACRKEWEQHVGPLRH